MKYTLKVVPLKGDNVRILVIDFEQPQYIALSDFFSDVDQFGLYIRENFIKVLSRKTDKLSFFCNLCTVIITCTTTTIISNFALEAGNETDRCEVNTEALVNLIDWWCSVKETWERTGALPSETGVWYDWPGL